ncbi:hypothetical protein SDC9_188191 [bioreactor metagenome]|uniref:Uncharacterized protein n=1 Tax=bioreactor metagenome TaxID=1076179 RepID=A0A645HZE4_9ZZZZ
MERLPRRRAVRLERLYVFFQLSSGRKAVHVRAVAPKAREHHAVANTNLRMVLASPDVLHREGAVADVIVQFAHRAVKVWLVADADGAKRENGRLRTSRRVFFQASHGLLH